MSTYIWSSFIYLVYIYNKRGDQYFYIIFILLCLDNRILLVYLSVLFWLERKLLPSLEIPRQIENMQTPCKQIQNHLVVKQQCQISSQFCQIQGLCLNDFTLQKLLKSFKVDSWSVVWIENCNYHCISGCPNTLLCLSCFC